MISPTRITLALCIGLLGLSVGALLVSDLLLPWSLVSIAVVLACVVDALLLPRRKQVTLERELTNEAPVGGNVRQSITVSYDGAGVLRGNLYDIRPNGFEGGADSYSIAVDRHEDALIEDEYTANERGRHVFNNATIEAFGPLRLMRRVIRLEQSSETCVIPGVDILSSNRLILQAMQDADAGATRARGIGRGGEFDSLAPYVPGDPPSSVDWKAYARSRQLAVRRFVPERRRQIMLACDAGRLMGGRIDGHRKVDHALKAFSRLAAAALKRGDLVGLMIFDGEVRTFIPPKGGPGQLAKIVRASLGVKPSHSETAFTPAFMRMNRGMPRRGLVVLATDFDNDAQGWELRRNVLQVSRRHVVMVAALRDPTFINTVQRKVQEPLDAYRQLASLTLMDERRAILDGIHALGVHTIDAEPEDLGIPMLNMYGRIVNTGRL